MQEAWKAMEDLQVPSWQTPQQHHPWPITITTATHSHHLHYFTMMWVVEKDTLRPHRSTAPSFHTIVTHFLTMRIAIGVKPVRNMSIPCMFSIVLNLISNNVSYNHTCHVLGNPFPLGQETVVELTPLQWSQYRARVSIQHPQIQVLALPIPVPEVCWSCNKTSGQNTICHQA